MRRISCSQAQVVNLETYWHRSLILAAAGFIAFDPGFGLLHSGLVLSQLRLDGRNAPGQTGYFFGQPQGFPIYFFQLDESLQVCIHGGKG